MRVSLSLVIVCLASCTADQAEVEQPATTPSLSLARTFVTDGIVTAAATDGATLYLGGAFHYIGQRSGEYALVSATSGARDKSVPELGGGDVDAILPDGSGGYFFAGDFRSAGSVSTRALAHLTSSSTWDPAWKLQIDGVVYALAHDSSRLYIGGSFNHVNGNVHRNFAAFDLATGALVAGTPDVGGAVRALAVSSTGLFLGGEFGSVGGITHSHLARLDLPAMTVAAWNPGTFDNDVRALFPQGTGLYVAGAFTTIGSLARGHVASIDQSTAVVRGYNPNTNGTVFAIQRLGTTLYLGGQFTTVGGQPHELVAAVDASNGSVLAWHPAITGTTVFGLLATTSAVYVGGNIDGYARAYDPASGSALAWNPKPNGGALAFATHPSGILLGGDFTSVGGYARTNFAAIDLSTGRPTSWAPTTDTDPNNRIETMLLRGSTLYVGGVFNAIDGQPRANLAALSTAGAVLPLRADTDGRVHTLTTLGSTLYVGGEFTQVAGAARNHLAAVDATSGALAPWNPGFTGTGVLTLVGVGSTIYAGGFGQNLAAYDATSGAAQPVPSVDGEVDALAYDGTNIYAAGFYNTIGGQARNSLASFAPGSTTVTSWNPATPQFRRFDAIGVSGSYVYVNDVGKIDTVDKTSGALASFTTRILNGTIDEIIPLADRILFLGGFHDIDNVAQQDVAEYLGTP